jgi:hypothetical protein
MEVAHCEFETTKMTCLRIVIQLAAPISCRYEQRQVEIKSPILNAFCTLPQG